MKEKDIAKKRRLLIHDLDGFAVEGILTGVSEDVEMLSAVPPVAHCVGCFGCWVATPGRCSIADRVTDYPSKLANCEELIIVSRLVYGGFSPSIKAVVDRIIPYFLPFFIIKDDRMRHPVRYENDLKLFCYFYKEPDERTFAIEGKTNESLIKVAAEGAGITFAADGATIFSAAKHDLAPVNGRGEEVSGAELAIMKRFVTAVSKNLGAVETGAFFAGNKMKLMGVKF
jgi:hypothetical protein